MKTLGSALDNFLKTVELTTIDRKVEGKAGAMILVKATDDLNEAIFDSLPDGIAELLRFTTKQKRTVNGSCRPRWQADDLVDTDVVRTESKKLGS